MGDSQWDLRGARIADSRSHFEAQALSEQFGAFFKYRLQAIKQTRPVLRFGPAPGRKCAAGRCNGGVYVSSVSKRNAAHWLFRGRIYYDGMVGSLRLPPFAVDEEPFQATGTG
jgi:hypothetical protein